MVALSIRRGGGSEQLGDLLGRGHPVQRLARSGVELTGDLLELELTRGRQVGSLREGLPQQPVGVLVRPALPRRVRIAEVDRKPGLDGKRLVRCELTTLIPG